MVLDGGIGMDHRETYTLHIHDVTEHSYMMQENLKRLVFHSYVELPAGILISTHVADDFKDFQGIIFRKDPVHEINHGGM